MRSAGEEFGSARGGNLLPLCRTPTQLRGPEIIRFRSLSDRESRSLFVSIDPAFQLPALRMRSASLKQDSLEKPHRPPAVRPSSVVMGPLLNSFQIDPLTLLNSFQIDPLTTWMALERFFMPLLMKRSCERVQASRNSCEKSRLGGVGRFGARCASIAHSSSLFAHLRSEVSQISAATGRNRLSRVLSPSQQPADIVTQRAFSLILWPILSQLLFGQFRVVAQRLVSEFALCHPTFLGEPHEDLYPFFLTFLGSAKLSRR